MIIRMIMLLYVIIFLSQTFYIYAEKREGQNFRIITNTCSYTDTENLIHVTEIETTTIDNKKVARLVLNNAIEINEIEIKKIDGRIVLKYPSYISERTGKEYKQIKIFTKQANDVIQQAILQNKVYKEIDKLTPMNFSISKYTPYKYKKENPRLCAFVSIVFNNAIEVETRLMRGKYGYWVAYPARPHKIKSKRQKWIPQVRIIDESLKMNVEKAIVNMYREIKLESPTEIEE